MYQKNYVQILHVELCHALMVLDVNYYLTFWGFYTHNSAATIQFQSTLNQTYRQTHSQVKLGHLSLTAFLFF